MDDACSVCLDTFKEPKLLRCCHTFCKTCLEGLVRSADHQSKKHFSCPLCRTQNNLASEGIAGYPNNYFVRDSRLPSRREHKKAGLDQESGDDGASTVLMDDLEEDGEVDEDDCTVMEQWTSERTLRFPRNDSKTDRHCTFLSSKVLEGARMISCLCSTPSDNCLVVADCSNVINVITTNGYLLTRYNVIPRVNIHDVVLRGEETLLLLASDINQILTYCTRSNTYSTFTSLVDFRGNDMASLLDGRLAVAGVNTSGSSSIRNEYGQLLLLSSTGSVLKRIGDEYMTFQPACVSVNTYENRICFTDVDRRTVSIISADGPHICDFKGRGSEHVYLRSILGDDSPRSTLNPGGLSCDTEGNVVVVDEATSSVFVLDHNGSFRGFMVLEDKESLYNPFLVACGPSETLWVGDKTQGKVNVYKISNYVNVFDRPMSDVEQR
ncbi:tripartite motif-containing protein 3-like [Ylistrum balloti]|uniref:tripartite motif-containing protein 3-like n=1 Tax=Ylistrum balloti TaxID=509963 RepID=UPI0029058207|nr:tripartite motif-containing protein 3-like [Ylistrum balloti]